MTSKLERLTEEMEEANRDAAELGTRAALGKAAYLNQQWTKAFYGQITGNPEQNVQEAEPLFS